MPRGSPGRRINVRLPEADYDNLRTLAYTKHTTVAEVAREILIDGLKAWELAAWRQTVLDDPGA